MLVNLNCNRYYRNLTTSTARSSLSRKFCLFNTQTRDSPRRLWSLAVDCKRPADEMVESMRAGPRKPRSENVDGPLWVDATCISCDTCRWMSPEHFHFAAGQSAVWRQPESRNEQRAALRAVVACPVGSIHFEGQKGKALQAASADFPMLMPDAEPLGLEIFHLGHHSPFSFGAAPWLLRNPSNGVCALVDVPRYSTGLKKSLERAFGPGKIRYMFLTHADDVADHDWWARNLGVRRVIHETEARDELALSERSATGLESCEIQLSGAGPWDPFQGELGEGTQVMYAPGHSVGHCLLHFQPRRNGPAALFTGDHLAKLRATGTLDAFMLANKYDFRLQLHSLESLAEARPAVDVRLVVPGHGRVWKTDDFPGDLQGVCSRLSSRIEDGSVYTAQPSN
uniref:Zn-dependent glyoxylase n=1 Tax=Tetraselmis sp. GSL018 TaxID=582737 RepID=A0A061R2Z9_9CHLO|mmetsp:Transcript_24117/g.57448  ORF Transcript_24117/g.57448 Transcript_24117/m.57448 type:complete len:397 (-) Transcript_24117:251-1441(-)